MPLAVFNYPQGNVFLTMLEFFLWIIWIWLLIVMFSDLFRRRDIGGWAKAGWFIVVLILPYFGVLIYLIACGKGMAERRMKDTVEAKQQLDDYVRSVGASGPSAVDQIARGKQLLDSGAITQAEFDTLKQQALSTG